MIFHRKSKKKRTPSLENSDLAERMTTSKELISFHNVSKSYQRGDRVFYALKEASMSILEGELVVVLGPSGAGKSTLLNLMGGMDSPTEGSILFHGEDISQYDDKQLTRYRADSVGVVFQFYNLVPTLTAFENVALMGEIQDDIDDPVEVLKSVGLERQIYQFPAQMSGGEQQRTSIARAIVKNPKLLLCDEPTGALDTNTGKEVLALLQSMCRDKKKTVVMVTHNAVFAEIADQVIYVRDGQIEKTVENKSPKRAQELDW